jgi:hypothetical protein
MSGIWEFLAGLVKAITHALAYAIGREQGRRVEKIEQNERVHESLTKAKDAVNRVDDDKSKRLRERYNIPE